MSHNANSVDSDFGGKQKNRKGRSASPVSESDVSCETNSLSNENQTTTSQENVNKKERRVGASKKGEWEILEGLKEGQRFDFVPQKFEGHLLKRRKWPLKGWHKRYFVLEGSVLAYAKSVTELIRGKLHGQLCIGMSVISTKAYHRRIDIDADTSILHLKCKSLESFLQWVEQLKQHRLHKQHQMLYTKDETKRRTSLSSPSEDSPVYTENLEYLCCLSEPLNAGISSVSSSLPNSRANTLVRDAKPTSAATMRGRNDFSLLDQVVRDLAETQHYVQQLQKLWDVMDITEENNSLKSSAFNQHVEPSTPSAKPRRKFRLRKSRSNKATGNSGSTGDITDKNFKAGIDVVDKAALQQLETNLKESKQLSCSNPTLAANSGPSGVGSDRPHSYSDTSPPSLPSSGVFPPRPIKRPPSITVSAENSNREDFMILAKEILRQISGMVVTLHSERERLRQTAEADSSVMGVTGNSSMGTLLRSSLNQALKQNAELRSRLARIHADSELTDVSTPPSLTEPCVVHKSLRNSLSYESSSCFSASEYFDAESGDRGSDSSSDQSSDNDSVTSDGSETCTDAHPSTGEIEESQCFFTGRRTRLPVPKSPTEDFSLWNFLYKNIGKDLSKVSMPVSLNEPLNLLQRLCEELEYSELLDKAATQCNPADRMLQVAAFAVSCYGSSIYRAASKPFNPLLGETYECIREDKGFRFVSEQVSHHPPISACHAESNTFTFWQDVRIKTKFWGRSLEFQPTGKVHVKIGADHYEWNKVTTVVHNLFGGGQRWVDQYGEMIIRDTTNGYICKLTFVRANSSASKLHEVYGSVANADGVVAHNLFGKWTEALYCGHAPSAKVIWRPGSLPEDYQSYYGFTRFAIELNELDEDQRKFLPPTDTRFRPDQRMLEEGNMVGAETLKSSLEQTQRDRRKKREEIREDHSPLWFRCENDAWLFNHNYWQKRKDPGFVNMTLDPLW